MSSATHSIYVRYTALSSVVEVTDGCARVIISEQQVTQRLTREELKMPPRGRVVFVGNIPYDMTEEQLIDIFKEVGPVVSFRLMFDRDTGKARGYGFCEFADTETAASAIRNCKCAPSYFY
jgi:hypothetical protein